LEFLNWACFEVTIQCKVSVYFTQPFHPYFGCPLIQYYNNSDNNVLNIVSIDTPQVYRLYCLYKWTDLFVCILLGESIINHINEILLVYLQKNDVCL
jgi:hypothetical protein